MCHVKNLNSNRGKILSEIFSNRILKGVSMVALFFALCFVLGLGLGKIIRESLPAYMGFLVGYSPL